MARKERLRDRDSLWLFPPPFHFLLAEEREEKREKEGCGERRRPQVTFWIISAMPAPGWLRGRKGGGCAGVKGKGVCAEVRGWGDRCVHFLCSLLGGSRRWIFTHSSPLHTPPCHWKVCENSTHEPAWERRGRSVDEWKDERGTRSS